MHDVLCLSLILETGEPAWKGRADRCIAVLTPTDHDAQLSAWTWSRGPTAYRAALDAEADAGRLPDLLAALGWALHLRRAGVDDLTATIAVRREAVRLARADDPMREPWLADLANSLRLRGDAAGDPADREEAHRLHAEAVASTPAGHPEYATVLSNLAGSHRDPARADRRRGRPRPDPRPAPDAVAATTVAPAGSRFVAAETAARLAADTGRWPVACMAYGAADPPAARRGVAGCRPGRAGTTAAGHPVARRGGGRGRAAPRRSGAGAHPAGARGGRCCGTSGRRPART